MIHAYASIWRYLMHDIIIELLEKACVHVHHLEISTQEWKWKQLSAIISDSRHANVSKQTTLQAGVDVAPPNGVA